MNDLQRARINRANETHDATQWTPEDVLHDAIQGIKDGRIAPNKIIVLMLDDTIDDAGKRYDVRYSQSSMYRTEMISLIEVFKHQLMREIDAQ